MESFEEMFEQSLKAIKPKTIISGEIIAITEEGEIFVNLGYKADGIITRKEFSYDENSNPAEKYKVGDTIEAFVLKLNDGRGNVELSLKKLEGDKTKEEFENSVANDETLEVKVSQVLDNGIRAKHGGVQIFVPLSQLVESDTKKYEGKTISIKIIENKRNRIIGSERIANREIKDAKAKETLSKIKVGDKLNGTVRKINEYGAFVDIGGVEGLLHVSQMTWKRNANPKDYVKEGQELEVEVIEFDSETNKISLKTKKDEENPWNKVGTEYKIEDICNVKVLKIVPFGVFVEIADGLEGFIHISQISEKRIANPGAELSVDQEVEAKIIKIDTENKKIELTIKGKEETIQEGNDAEEIKEEVTEETAE